MATSLNIAPEKTAAAADESVAGACDLTAVFNEYERIHGKVHPFRDALQRAGLESMVADMMYSPRMAASLATRLEAKHLFRVRTSTEPSDTATIFSSEPARSHTLLSSIVDAAMDEFVNKNALAGLSVDRLAYYLNYAFSMALDTSLVGYGGKQPARGTAEYDVVYEYGLVSDAAEWVEASNFDGAKWVSVGRTSWKVGLTEYILCVKAGTTHRFEVLPSTMALNFRLFGRQPVLWSGDGMEQSLADYFARLVQAAYCRRIKLEQPTSTGTARPPDLEALRRYVSAAWCGQSGCTLPLAVWRVALPHKVETVDDAMKTLGDVVDTDGTPSAPAEHLVVALNGGGASFADVMAARVVVSGARKQKKMTHLLLLKSKHYPAGSITVEEVRNELNKMKKRAETAIQPSANLTFARGFAEKAVRKFVIARLADSAQPQRQAYPAEFLHFNTSSAKNAFYPSTMGATAVPYERAVRSLHLLAGPGNCGRGAFVNKQQEQRSSDW